MTVVTCVIRPAGAIEAARSVQASAPHPFDLQHVLAYWPEEPDLSRVRVAPWLTQVIAGVGEGWVMFVDDDNRLHPQILGRLGELVAAHPHARAFIFGCQYPEMHNGYIPASPGVMRPGSVDGGQIAIEAELARSIPIEPHDCYDGAWLGALYRENKRAFVFVNEPLTYHNHQVWG